MRTKIQLELCPRPELPGFCWAWTGCLNSSGYGCVGIDGKRLLSHRAAYTLLVGQIPAGLQLDHLCRNITCCNPGHLDPVTGKTNCERSDPATKLRCINGHPLVGPNLYIKSLPNGLTKRECRTCRMLMLSRADDSRGRKRRPSESVAIRRARMLAESEAVLRSGELSA
jgi:hypothetical protein